MNIKVFIRKLFHKRSNNRNEGTAKLLAHYLDIIRKEIKDGKIQIV